MASQFSSALLVVCVLTGTRPTLGNRMEVDLSKSLGQDFRAISSEWIQVNTGSEGESERREGSNVSTACSDEQCSKCCCKDTKDVYEDGTSDEIVKKRIKVATPGNKETQECKGTSYGLFRLGKCFDDCSKCSSKGLQYCQSPPEDICCRVVKPGGEHWTVMHFPWYESRGKDCAAQTGHIIAEDLCLNACEALKINRMMSQTYAATFRTKRGAMMTPTAHASLARRLGVGLPLDLPDGLLNGLLAALLFAWACDVARSTLNLGVAYFTMVSVFSDVTINGAASLATALVGLVTGGGADFATDLVWWTAFLAPIIGGVLAALLAPLVGK